MGWFQFLAAVDNAAMNICIGFCVNICFQLSWVYESRIAWSCGKSVVFLGGSAGKESTCSVRDLGSIPGLGRCAGEGNGSLLQYSDLENSVDRIVHGVSQSWTRLSTFHVHFHGNCVFNLKTAAPFYISTSYVWEFVSLYSCHYLFYI